MKKGLEMEEESVINGSLERMGEFEEGRGRMIDIVRR